MWLIWYTIHIEGQSIIVKSNNHETVNYFFFSCCLPEMILFPLAVWVIHGFHRFCRRCIGTASFASSHIVQTSRTVFREYMNVHMVNAVQTSGQQPTAKDKWRSIMKAKRQTFLANGQTCIHTYANTVFAAATKPRYYCKQATLKLTNRL